MAPPGCDILVVSIGGTLGWSISTQELVESLRRAGARVEVVAAPAPPHVRTFALTDLLEARAARQAALRGIEGHSPNALIYCSITAALLWPRPGAIWLDSLAAENRPGRHGVWQRPVERRRLGQTPLILAMSLNALDSVVPRRPVEFVPVPVARSGPLDGPRDLAAVTYAGNPEKKRLDLVLEAWGQARRGEERLVVAGLDGLPPRAGVESAGRLDPAAYRALLRRARVFLAAPRREDYGIAPLEALADGCQLVTTPAPGPYPARGLAQELDPRLVTQDLAGAIRVALDDPRPDYADRAADLLAPFSPQAVDQAVTERVLPRLLSR